MPADPTYANAKKAFQALSVGERVSALELSDRIGATIYQEKKKVAAFLSQRASKGRAGKHLGEDGRMYYEKMPPTPKPVSRRPSRVAPSTESSRDRASLEQIGERIADHIERLKGRVSDLEKERDTLREKVSIFSKQRQEFKRLYEEAQQRIEELSAQRPSDLETERTSKLGGQ
jgi:hypothetical protein